ncbi:hypothetical protein ACWCZ5_35130, partial [Streptomyces sp. NPDC001667]
GTFGEKNVHDRQEFLTEERDGPGLLKTFTTFRVEAYDGTAGSTRKFGLTTTVICTRPDLTLNTLNVDGATDLRGNTQTRHLTCVDGNSIRTKHLRGLTTPGNRELIIDDDGTGVDIGGATTFNSAVTVGGDAQFDGHITQAAGKTLRTGNVRPLTGGNANAPKTLTIGDSAAAEKVTLLNAAAGNDFTVAGNSSLTGHVTVENGLTVTPTPNTGVLYVRHIQSALPKGSTVYRVEFFAPITGNNGSTLAIGSAVSGLSVTVNKDSDWTGWWHEDKDGWNEAPSNKVMVGRNHHGDENGGTWHKYASLSIRGGSSRADDEGAPLEGDGGLEEGGERAPDEAESSP